VLRKPVFDREDVDAILSALWDIKLLLIRLVRVMENGEEEAES